MTKVYYYDNDLCWTILHGSAPKLVRLRRWSRSSKSWLCEAVDWHYNGDLYVQPRMLNKVQDVVLCRHESKTVLSPSKLCRHERLSSESNGTRNASEDSSIGSTELTSGEEDSNDHQPDNQGGPLCNKQRQQRATKRQVIPLQCDGVSEWYIKDQPPESYVREAKKVLSRTPFECDINPDKTAQIIALIAFRTHQSPRDAFEKFLFHLGRSRTSPHFSSAIRPEEVDRAGERHGLYANMRSVLI
jgi:hypothetical protein